MVARFLRSPSCRFRAGSARQLRTYRRTGRASSGTEGTAFYPCLHCSAAEKKRREGELPAAVRNSPKTRERSRTHGCTRLLKQFCYIIFKPDAQFRQTLKAGTFPLDASAFPFPARLRRAAGQAAAVSGEKDRRRRTFLPGWIHVWRGFFMEKAGFMPGTPSIPPFLHNRRPAGSSRRPAPSRRWCTRRPAVKSFRR